MKKYIKICAFPLASILILPLIFSIINLLGMEISKIIYTIFIIIFMLISGFILGLNIKDKGYLKGLAYGSAIAFIMFILSFILQSSHSLYNVIYYLIIIASTTLGTMFGVNKSSK